MPRKGQVNHSPARREAFSTVTERDEINFFRFMKKVIKEKMNKGDTIRMPPHVVAQLARDMCAWYRDHWDRELDRDGHWDEKIREFLTQ